MVTMVRGGSRLQPQCFPTTQWRTTDRHSNEGGALNTATPFMHLFVRRANAAPPSDACPP